MKTIHRLRRFYLNNLCNLRMALWPNMLGTLAFALLDFAGAVDGFVHDRVASVSD